MVINKIIRIVTLHFLLLLALPVQARIDDAEIEIIRAFIARQEQKPLLYSGIMVKDKPVAGPSERDEERFLRTRKMLQSEMQHWNSRIQIITSWPQDQAVRAIGDGFIEIIDLGHAYERHDPRQTTRAEAVKRLVTRESDGIINFINGVDEFERRFYASAGDGLKGSFDSMKSIAPLYLKSILTFVENRSNKALLDIYNENRQAYLNRNQSRYAERYLEAVNGMIDFERITYVNAADVSPRNVAKEMAAYSERLEEVKELLELYLNEQRKSGNNDHATRLKSGFDRLFDDFERAKDGFRGKFPQEARREKL